MAGLTLTQWWKAFSNDLESLAPKVTNADSIQWNAARIMIEAGSQIEDNFIWGLTYANKINEASRNLGMAYENKLTQKLMYLPDISSPELLLFALVYYHHLCRYQLIGEGNALIVKQLISGRAEIADAAEEVKRRIDSYCADPKNIQLIEQDFPEIAMQDALGFLEKIEKWCAKEPVIIKISKQLEDEAKLLIQEYASQGELNVLCSSIERLLEDKIKIFREIAAYKQLIELLKSGVLLPDDLQKHQVLEKTYPDYWRHWFALDAIVPHKTPREIQGVKTRTAIIDAVLYTGGILKSVTQWTIGYITPGFISRPVHAMANTVSEFTHALLPSSLAEQRKQLLIISAEKKIAEKVSALNKSGSRHQLVAQDFDKMNASEVDDLAEKIQLIHKLVSLCNCLSVYEKKNTTSYIKFSLSIICKPVTYFMSQTFLRHLLFDKVLYILEAKNLQGQINAFLKAAKTQNDGFEHDVLERKVKQVLNEAEDRANMIHSKSPFAFFMKEEMQRAYQQYDEVVSLHKDSAPAA